MNQMLWQGLALVVLLLPLPLISAGATVGSAALWAAGLALLALGGAVPAVLRFVPAGDDGEDGENDNDG